MENHKDDYIPLNISLEKDDTSAKKFSDEEKQEILRKINQERLTKQKTKEVALNRTKGKKIYQFGSNYFYKFKNMEREYYIEVEVCKKISTRAQKVLLHYKTFDDFNHKEVLIKTEVFSEQFSISYNLLRVYFKKYSLEDEA